MVSFKGFCQFPGYADGNIRIQRRQSLHGFDDAMGGFIKNTGVWEASTCRLEHSVFFPGFDGQKTAEEECVRRQPDPTNAVTTADGPGRTVKLTPFSLRVWMRR